MRAEQLGTLDRFSHELFIDDEIGRLLEELRDYEEEVGHDSLEGSLIRITRRDYEKAKRVPPELRAEMTRAGAIALPPWIEAREKSDFSIFLPYLKRNLELVHEYIACFEGMGFESEYDVLLDDFDEGLKADEVRTVFDELKRELVPLIAQIAENADRVDDSSLHGDFPIEKQRAFALEVLERFGFDHESWRLDPTVHPFAMSAGTKDIRLTTRYDETDLSVSLFATIHEFGHGFYEANVDPAFERTSLSSVTSMSLHESQSRMWENLVGRGLPAWRFFYPRIQEAFPAQFGRRRARRVLRRDQQGAALAHPRRGGRGDVQPAHHPALRARAGDPLRRASARGPAGGLERADGRVPRDRRARTTRRASSRTSTGRAGRSATSRRTRSGT